MGNHVAGQAVGLAAEQALSLRQPGETALSILDRICKKYRGCDAEFEAEDPDNPGKIHPDFDSYTDPHHKAALGLLMVEAFAPNGLADLAKYAAMLDSGGGDDVTALDKWAEEVDVPFRKRYGFW